MLDQLAIALLGTTAIFLSQQQRPHWQRYACLFGLAAQPFWFYASYQASQWGIFLVSILYALAWLTGFRTHWLKPARQAS